jgi:RNA polymerase sigma factor (sigma-70 family)
LEAAILYCRAVNRPASEPLATRESLIRRVRRQRDQQAWSEFVYYYRGYVYGIARRMGLTHHDAEEVVQTVMVKLWKTLPDFEYDERKGRFRGWLCTVAGNEVKMLLRSRAAKANRLTPEEQVEVQGYLHRVQPEPSAAVAEQEWIRYVTTLAWQRVGPDFTENEKTAFELMSKGVDVETIAKKLKLAPSSVYVYKKRVHDRLREELVRLNRELD